jgi:hypothetical protein
MPAKRSKTPLPTNGNLEQAMALLIQNQAAFMSAFLAQQSRADERFSRIDGRFSHIDERFSRIEERLDHIERLLIGLPEAVREKIGVKAR